MKNTFHQELVTALPSPPSRYPFQTFKTSHFLQEKIQTPGVVHLWSGLALSSTRLIEISHPGVSVHSSLCSHAGHLLSLLPLSEKTSFQLVQILVILQDPAQNLPSPWSILHCAQKEPSCLVLMDAGVSLPNRLRPLRNSIGFIIDPPIWAHMHVCVCVCVCARTHPLYHLAVGCYRKIPRPSALSLGD